MDASAKPGKGTVLNLKSRVRVSFREVDGSVIMDGPIFLERLSRWLMFGAEFEPQPPSESPGPSARN